MVFSKKYWEENDEFSVDIDIFAKLRLYPTPSPHDDVH